MDFAFDFNKIASMTTFSADRKCFRSALENFIELPPFKVPAAVPDKQERQVPDREQFSGMLGARIKNNAINRLLVTVDTDRVLEGFRKRPGRQTWDGDIAGKWIEAATLAWANIGNTELRAKLDHTVSELLKCQLEDGYLGTYEAKDYWTEWDLWCHSIDLIGLTTYIRYTGNQEPLATCKQIGDLLCRTYGESPGRKNILDGLIVGMANSTVLESMVLIYRMTGEKRYRDFCEYILRAWETEKGPHIVSRLLDKQGVNKVGNAKAYEMLACINGMLEWYRVTGDAQLLQAALNAWEDIVSKRLYITGTCSSYERFQNDHELPNIGKVGETCVTVTWLQFNAHLLRLTGEARFADQIERTAYNQLSGAQRPNGKGWGYYVQMEGIKPYSEDFTAHCCLSSGPRAWALIPTLALTTDADGVVVNLYDNAIANLTLSKENNVELLVESRYPSEGSIKIHVKPAKAQTFALRLRIPSWCEKASLQVVGQPAPLTLGKDGYVALIREWEPGDIVTLTLPLEPRIIAGEYNNKGRAAIAYGPLVLCADEYLSNAGDSPCLPGLDLAAMKFAVEPAKGPYLDWSDAKLFSIMVDEKKYGLAPFSTAGSNGISANGHSEHYRVWLDIVE